MSGPSSVAQAGPRGSADVLGRLLRRLRRAIPRRRVVRYQGLTLPARHMRGRMCGVDYTRDGFFLESGRAEARRLVEELGYVPGARVVEIGSGLGRLAIGLVREAGDDVRYVGFDAAGPWIAWCRQHIERRYRSFRFVHVDVRNELYNPRGAALERDFAFPIPDGHADIVYMWGVFTNMRLADAAVYVAEIGRMLAEGGRAFLTAFVEDGVPDESINPPDYVDYACDMPLQVVRYSTAALFALFAQHGMHVRRFDHHGGTHCKQSLIYLEKETLRGQPAASGG